METSKTSPALYFIAIVMPFIIVMLGTWVWSLYVQLEVQQLRVQDLHERLREERVPVQISCICPAYEDGWDDAEFVEDLDCERGYDIEDLELMRVELDELGYVPDC